MAPGIGVGHVVGGGRVGGWVGGRICVPCLGGEPWWWRQVAACGAAPSLAGDTRWWVGLFGRLRQTWPSLLLLAVLLPLVTLPGPAPGHTPALALTQPQPTLPPTQPNPTQPNPTPCRCVAIWSRGLSAWIAPCCTATGTMPCTPTCPTAAQRHCGRKRRPRRTQHVTTLQVGVGRG